MTDIEDRLKELGMDLERQERAMKMEKWSELERAPADAQRRYGRHGGPPA